MGAALPLAGCDDQPLGKERSADAPLVARPTLCDVSSQIFEPHCVGCHSGSTAPDLRLSALQTPPALEDQTSELYGGVPLLTPGNRSESLLYRKLAGPRDNEGARMPLGSPLTDTQIELIGRWIDDGAPMSCASASVTEDAGAPVEGEVVTAGSMCELLTRRCASCHGTERRAPDLTVQGIPALVGSPSSVYEGRTFVVPEDVEGSFLYPKVAGTQGPTEGQRMPPGQAALSAEELSLIASWIEEGAATSICEGVDPGEVAPVDISPGGDVDVGPPPSRFAETPPDFADGLSCSTGQWWQYPEEDETGLSMHPGVACVECHYNSGDNDAPRFSYAGTVMADLRDEDDCRGVPGVTVDILDVDDQIIATTTTNTAGNFGLLNPPFETFRVRLTWEGRTREMAEHQGSTGDCNRCHTASGENGAPGRIVAP
ncbi:MAG: c-type cytochrome [Myxococcota bacterium]